MADPIDRIIGQVLRAVPGVEYEEISLTDIRAAEFWLPERPGRIAAVEWVGEELYVRGQPSKGEGFDCPDVVGSERGALVRVVDFLSEG